MTDVLTEIQAWRNTEAFNLPHQYHPEVPEPSEENCRTCKALRALDEILTRAGVRSPRADRR